MTEERDRTVRLSQTITPFGVGGIYDFLGESLIACDTNLWRGRGDTIRLPRLEDQLRVESFKAAPSQASLFGRRTVTVPYHRFPSWLFCPRCRRMHRWSRGREEESTAPTCPASGCRSPQLVPMRFVVVCPGGHLDDLDWKFWAHAGEKALAARQCDSDDLRFESAVGGGTGLASLYVSCATCGSSRSLAGISSKDSLNRFNIRCTGRQPWEQNRGACDEVPQVLQRGATNIYFAQVASALDIPPGSRFDPYGEIVTAVTSTPEFQVIRSNPDSPLAPGLAEQLALRHQITSADVMEIVRAELAESARSSARRPAEPEDLQTGEWRAFLAENDETDHRHRFVTRTTKITGADPSVPEQELAGLVSRVVLATRLREVRALTGFTRYRPDGDIISPDLGRGVIDWLPAIEVYGEGVFIALDEAALRRWEGGAAQIQRAEQLERRRAESLFGPRIGFEATPRSVLLHTLSHLLIRQLAFDCGYSSSSLRERIYARGGDDPSEAQAGILIYTAAGDAEGTLGGLVRQGEPPHLASTVLSALESAAWCSSDPLCSESPGQGFGALNRGACHACSLVAETSCAHFNALLDRWFVVGPAPGTGFFYDVVEAALSEETLA